MSYKSTVFNHIYENETRTASLFILAGRVPIPMVLPRASDGYSYAAGSYATARNTVRVMFMININIIIFTVNNN